MEIPSASQTDKAVLGEGYDSKKESFVGECVTGETIYVGVQESSFIFSRSLSTEELSNSLGFSIGAKARYGVVKGSLSARFASEASSTDYSEATIYSAQYRFKNKKLKYTGLTSVGQAAKGFSDTNFVGENWELVCGHEYVEQVTLGAGLYLSAKIEFSTKAEKQEFNLAFKIKGPAFKVSSQLDLASKSFGSRASITIQAYQLGGDVSRLGAVFGTGSNARITLPDGKNIHALLVCSMDNPSACLKLLDNALLYATDTQDPNAFSQQIRPDSDFANTDNPNGPAELSYITSPWSNLALIPPPAIITDLIEAARKDLSSEFEKNLEYRDRINALLTGPIRLSPNQRTNIEGADRLVSENLRLINEAAVVCYTTLGRCVEKVSETRTALKVIDESKLEVLPESLAQWYDIKDLPSTKKSIQPLLNELENIAREKVVNFDAVEDKAATVERIALEIDSLTLGSGITDITPLSSLKNLKFLYIQDEITDVSAFTSTLSSLTGLTDLLITCRVVDLGFLRPLTNLQNLYIVGGASNDLSPLSSLVKLKRLGLVSFSNIIDVGPLSSLINLVDLTLSSTQVVNINPLASLTNLTSLVLRQHRIVDISPLASLTNLIGLNLDENKIVDVSPLSPIVKLEYLHLNKNQIVDVSSLASLTSLKYLYLAYNQIVDVSPLASLTNLRILMLQNNPIASMVCPVADPTGKICIFDPPTESVSGSKSSFTIQALLEEDNDSYLIYPNPFSKQIVYRTLKESVTVERDTSTAYYGGQIVLLSTVSLSEDLLLTRQESFSLSSLVSDVLQPVEENLFEQVNGIIRNESSRNVWVVETTTGSAIAHILAPRKSSPSNIDADGVKAYDLGVTLSGHTSWWKIYDPDTAIIGDLLNGQQKIFSFAGFKVEEDEFGRVTYDYTQGWGV